MSQTRSKTCFDESLKQNTIVDPYQNFNVSSHVTEINDKDAQHIWGEQWESLKSVVASHEKYDTEDTPKLPDAVVTGARRLLHQLEAGRVLPPEVIAGTADATIVFEWHDWTGPNIFRSLEVISETEAEEFIRDPNNNKTTLEMVTF